VLFQPSIAGVDQAGLIEIIEGIVMNRFSDPAQQTSLLRDVFLTGGNTLFRGFEERLASELRGVLPTDYAATVRRARDPILDAWKGAAGWWAGSSRADRAAGSVSRAEYLERGSEYLKVCLLHCLPAHWP
jgi:actin-related protein 5